MGHNGLLWVTMGFYGSQWVSMGQNGFLWVIVGFYGSQGDYMGYNGFLWVCVSYYGVGVGLHGLTYKIPYHQLYYKNYVSTDFHGSREGIRGHTSTK